MNRIIAFLAIIFLFSGCSSEVGKQFKTNYFGVEEVDMSKDRINELRYIAQLAFMKTEYKDQYDPISAEIDNKPKMLKAIHYVFIHFGPAVEHPELLGSTYCVVIRRYNDNIVHKGIYTQPEGDPFYRYAGMLADISM